MTDMGNKCGGQKVGPIKKLEAKKEDLGDFDSNRKEHRKTREI